MEPTLAGLTEGQRRLWQELGGTPPEIASLLDLAGTKASVIQKRAAARDYIDLDVLLSRGGVDLVDALAAARKVYGKFFNPQITLKALCYYEDGDLMTVPEDARARLMAEVAKADLRRLVELSKDEGQK